jgi:glycosyltransferase involved in cell wall biosynthesis
MDLDDIPSLFFQSVGGQEKKLVRRWAAAWRVRVSRQREQRLPERFDVLGVCSETDRAYLNLGDRVHVIPNGFNPPAVEPAYRPVDPPRIGFIGAFDYAPNAEGVRWFLAQCWPRIKQALPTARFRIVGRGATREAIAAGPDVDVLGWLAKPTEEIASWSAMVVPLQIGAGTRIKVAEGFSRKCPVVSTSLGAYGYDVTSGRELFIADAAHDFAASCVRAVEQRAESAAMVERAWKRYLEQWTWQAIQPRVWAAAESCLRMGRINGAGRAAAHLS